MLVEVTRLVDGHIQLLSQGLRIRGMREDGAGNCVHSVIGAAYISNCTDTMLNIYFGDMPEAIYNTEVYFKNTYQDAWICDDFAKAVIWRL